MKQFDSATYAEQFLEIYSIGQMEMKLTESIRYSLIERVETFSATSRHQGKKKKKKSRTFPISSDHKKFPNFHIIHAKTKQFERLRTVILSRLQRLKIELIR